MNGTEKQQEFADTLVTNFCKRFCKYLCWAVKDGLLTDDEVEDLLNTMFDRINDIDEAKWWCNKKDTNDMTIAAKLLVDDEDYLKIVKKLKKAYFSEK